MRTHPLDSAFKDGLQGNSAKVPAGMWESIQTQLPQPKPVKGTLAYWIIGSALIIAFLGALMLWPKSTNQNNQIEDKSFEPKAQQTFAIVAADNNQNENVALNSEQDDKESAHATENLNSSNERNTNIDIVNSSAAQMASSVKSDTSNHTPASQIPGNNDVIKQSKSRSAFNSLLAVEESQLDKNAGTENTNNRIENNEVRIAPIYPVDAEVTYKSEIGLKVTDCYAFDKQSSGQFLVEVYTGPTFSIRNLSSRSENVDDYISARDSTESSQLSWHAGLRVGYEHKSGLTGRAGLQYTLVNEVFKQESKYSRVVIDSIFNSGGDLIRIDTTLETGTRVKQTQNRYHAIDIPLLVGYRIDNGNWDIGIQAGPIFNIVFNAKGDMINPSTGRPGSFSDTTDPDFHAVFKDKIGLSIYASVYASKRIGDKLWAFVEPHLQYRLKSITLDSYPVTQKRTNIGLSIGLRYKF